MKVLHDQKGSSHLVLLLALVVVAAVAFAGYRVMNSGDVDSGATLTSTRSTAVPKKLESTSDVLKAEKSLDNTAIESSVDPSQLDSDINSLL